MGLDGVYDPISLSLRMLLKIFLANSFLRREQRRCIPLLAIGVPRIKCIERSKDNCYAKFVVEPLERGYGITSGNSLSRSLISVLLGSKVTLVQIEGVHHKYSKIPGVLECVMDIICNLKSLELKGYTDEPRVIRLGAQGGGIVRAADIITDPDIEILNPDLKLATLDRVANFIWK